ncbi:uncharacterized protein [Branchiostoma lanceolatum]|uniref:uncharacterized protein n=1 Tax=Branchiostoma lanceolatum TaxID=7740 RepID=UPI0034535A75
MHINLFITHSVSLNLKKVIKDDVGLQDDDLYSVMIDRELEVKKAQNKAEESAKAMMCLQAEVEREHAENSKLEKELQETKKASERSAEEMASLQDKVPQEQEENVKLEKALGEFKFFRGDHLTESKTEIRDIFRDELMGMEDNRIIILEKKTLEASVKELTWANEKQTKKLDTAKKSYGKLLVALENQKEVVKKKNKDSSTATDCRAPGDRPRQQGNICPSVPSDRYLAEPGKAVLALETTVKELKLAYKAQAKELEDNRMILLEKKTREASVKELTLANEKQAKVLEQLQADLEYNKAAKESSNKTIHYYLGASEKLLADNDTLARGVTEFESAVEGMDLSDKCEDPGTPCRHGTGEGRSLRFEEWEEELTDEEF